MRRAAPTPVPCRVRLVAGMGFLVLMFASAANGACAHGPDVPACATATVPFASLKAADDCRLEMLTFRDRMNAYAACLGQTSADAERQAHEAYEDIRVRFNRRARGEFGKTPGADPE